MKNLLHHHSEMEHGNDTHQTLINLYLEVFRQLLV